MGVPILVLDEGSVELIEAWGRGRDQHMRDPVDAPDDPFKYPDMEVGIIEAARQSTSRAFKGWSEDAKLLRYLMEHKHDTPFEFAGMIIQVQAPIFVFREWQRHRTQSYNEMSARYIPLPSLYYRPALQETIDRALLQGVNKQAQSVRIPSPDILERIPEWLMNVDHAYKQLEYLYQQALQNGIPKELARITMPVGHYSCMRASANLRNWLAFLTLRLDPNAQFEIRQYAEAVGIIIRSTFPRTWELFCERNKR